jgi:hypothetical protein
VYVVGDPERDSSATATCAILTSRMVQAWRRATRRAANLGNRSESRLGRMERLWATLWMDGGGFAGLVRALRRAASSQVASRNTVLERGNPTRGGKNESHGTAGTAVNFENRSGGNKEENQTSVAIPNIRLRRRREANEGTRPWNQGETQPPIARDNASWPPSAVPAVRILAKQTDLKSAEARRANAQPSKPSTNRAEEISIGLGGTKVEKSVSKWSQAIQRGCCM